MKKIYEIEKGKKVKIKKIIESDFYLKLIEMGFLPNEEIYIENIAPLGDPISIHISGNTVCLRLCEAENIIVE